MSTGRTARISWNVQEASVLLIHWLQCSDLHKFLDQTLVRVSGFLWMTFLCVNLLCSGVLLSSRAFRPNEDKAEKF